MLCRNLCGECMCVCVCVTVAVIRRMNRRCVWHHRICCGKLCMCVSVCIYFGKLFHTAIVYLEHACINCVINVYPQDRTHTHTNTHSTYLEKTRYAHIYTLISGASSFRPPPLPRHLPTPHAALSVHTVSGTTYSNGIPHPFCLLPSVTVATAVVAA